MLSTVHRETSLTDLHSRLHECDKAKLTTGACTQRLVAGWVVVVDWLVGWLVGWLAG